MEIQQNKTISIRYWFTWGLVTALGIAMLLVCLGSYNYRPLCSPVIGCGYEIPLALTILISGVLLVIRVFKKNKLKLITPFILLVFSALVVLLILSVEKRFNASMKSLAKNIQILCIKNDQCPVTLSATFDDVRLVKAGTIFILEGVEDEIIENPENIIAAGYTSLNEDSESLYRYKLKPYYGSAYFDYKATGSNFKLEWVAEEAKIRRARVTSDASQKLLYETYCNPGGEPCYHTGSSYL